jgi:hypothetical protein
VEVAEVEGYIRGIGMHWKSMEVDELMELKELAVNKKLWRQSKWSELVRIC